ncbi:MAG: T9SS type A sorting domain-containing protein [Bacteroidota bacterium]|nr:T9SS type A sorting domain-containing protein [Bacteroidota bacterium]
MFSLKRKGITSLSPFAVFGKSGTNVSKIEKEINFEIYPNPVNDIISIAGSHVNNSNTGVEIINMQGQVVYSKILSEKENSISINHLNNGYYIIRLNNNQTSLVKKFIKM